MPLVKTIADFSTTLTLKTAVGATTATLTSGLDQDGVQLPTGTYGFTVDRNNSAKEHFTATLTGAALTNIQTVTRGTGAGTSGLLRVHRKGAEVIITDHVALKRMLNVLDTGYEEAVTPTTDYQLATKKYVDDTAFGGATTFNKTVVGGTCGENVSAGNLLYLSTDGTWYKTDADTASTIYNVKLGIAQGSGTTGNAITGGVLIYGEDGNQSGMTIGNVQYASNTAGGISSSAGTYSRVIGEARSSTLLYFDPYYNTDVFSKKPTITVIPLIKTIRSASMQVSTPCTTQFDITNPAGTTFRYTWDGTGTDPSLPGTAVAGQTVQIQAQNFTAANNGTYTVTAVGTNYFEITNASGVAETDKTVGTGYIVFNANYTKSTGLAYIRVRLVGAGGGAGGADAAATDESAGAGGGGGGYSEEVIAAASLAATETVIVGFAGLGGANTGGNGLSGNTTSFGSFLSATGGTGGNGDDASPQVGSSGGSGTGGDINLSGAFGFGTVGITTASLQGGKGGDSHLGFGGYGGSAGVGPGNGGLYGAGGGGAFSNNGSATDGASGANAVVIIEEYFN